jgi:hypothetical protein
MSDCNFNQVLDTKKYTIRIDSKANCGYFEHNILGEEISGNLLFSESSCQLIDYDGVSQLPKEVKNALHQNGRIQDEELANF